MSIKQFFCETYDRGFNSNYHEAKTIFPIVGKLKYKTRISTTIALVRLTRAIVSISCYKDFVVENIKHANFV